MDIIVLGLKLIIMLNFFAAFYYSVKNYKSTKSHVWLFFVMSVGTAFLLSSLRFVKEFFYSNFEQFESFIVVIELVKINLVPFVTAFLLAAAVTIYRERIAAVIPMGNADEPRLHYGIEKGTAYLVTEEIPRKTYHVFGDLLSSGYRGLGISRTPPDEVRREHTIDVPLLWLSRLHVGENVVSPNLKVIEEIIEEFLENKGKNAILLERLDYLISQNGFEETLQFIQKLSSLVYVTKSIALLHIDPLTIKERELILIEKETKQFKEEQPELEEELLEVLRYVYEKNIRGVKPNLKQVTKDLSLSRNTARKRINTLRLRNFLILKEKGREKVLEITRMGEDFV